jgi:7,8-dihydroneopterin aldolase/epimerase/oxygenase
MDRIIIDELELWLRVGVPDTERAEPQRLLVSLGMTRDLRRAAESDDLSATIDYHAVTVRLKQFGEGREWKLIERLASDVARLVLEEFGAEAVSVEVKKFILPDTRYVSVEIQRRQGE